MLPITEDKFLLKLLGRTLLEHQIQVAGRAGLAEFVIVASPQNVRRIEEIVAGIPGIKVDLAMQEEPKGIGDALASTAGLLEGEIIIASPNNVFCESAYTALLDARRSGSAVSYLLGYEGSDYFPDGCLVVDPASHLTHVVEKPGEGNEPSNMVNVLVHLHTDPARLLEYVDSVQTDRDDVYERALDGMVEDEHVIRVVPYGDFWAPVKYPWHVFAVVRQLLDSSPGYIAPSADVSKRAVVEGKVILADNVRVFENAVIRGPVYIGPNSVIGNGSLIRGYSHIGSDCVVGYATEVKGSYVGDGCWFHMGYVGDSVIGEACSFGANTVFTNWRFDEENIPVRVGREWIDSGLDKLGAIVGNTCRTGANATLMPGVKVGPNSVVGAQVCLTRDLEPDTIAVAKSGSWTTLPRPSRIRAE